jgi:hypothetical protein
MAFGLGYADGGEFLGARRSRATAGATLAVASDGRVAATSSGPGITSGAGHNANRSRGLARARQ